MTEDNKIVLKLLTYGSLSLKVKGILPTKNLKKIAIWIVVVGHVMLSGVEHAHGHGGCAQFVGVSIT